MCKPDNTNLSRNSLQDGHSFPNAYPFIYILILKHRNIWSSFSTHIFNSKLFKGVDHLLPINLENNCHTRQSIAL